MQQLPREALSHCPKYDGVPRLYLRTPSIKKSIHRLPLSLRSVLCVGLGERMKAKGK